MTLHTPSKRKQLGRFLETYRGSSFPTRAETSEGEVCVIKMRGAGNGGAALISEFLVNRLASRCGLPVPDAGIVEIVAGHPWNFGTDEFHDLVRKSTGANLALACLAGADPVRPQSLASLPDELVSQVVTIDLTFANLDRSIASANLLQDVVGKFWIIDHGSCRFLFQHPVESARTLPRDHLFAGSDGALATRWLAEASSASFVSSVVAEIPDIWLADVNLSRDEVRRRTLARLERP